MNIELAIHYEDGRTQEAHYDLPLNIGRDASCGLCLKGWRVARQHARLVMSGKSVHLEDSGSLAGTVINGKRVGPQTALQEGDEVIIGPCLIEIRRIQSETEAAQPGEQACPATPEGLAKANRASNCDTPDSIPDEAAKVRTHVAPARLLLERQQLHRALLEALDLRRRDISALSDTALREEAGIIVGRLVKAEKNMVPEALHLQLVNDVVNEAVGLGPLESLLADSDITEIMVNRHDEIFVERAGKLQRHPTVFSSEQAVLAVIDRIVSPIGRRIDESVPMVDARLKDGSRVNAVIPPVSLRGASLTIRKFPERRLTMSDLLQVGALSDAMGRFLQACVALRCNILVSGGTGSGKTTLLNVLSNCIPEGERIITIEDSAELKLAHAHLVTLEARPANLEGRGRIDIRDLVRNALRMRPDRIVVGECRGAEAFDMLAAMNTGHEGSLTTLHANSARDALGRLETMILMAGMDLPLAAVREHISGSIDLIVQQARLASGRRLITAIVEVTGIESGRIQTQTLFEYLPGDPAFFQGCGLMPECLGPQDLSQANLDPVVFSARSAAGHSTGSLSGVSEKGPGE
ncbi:MAG: Flp pilus assembly complex ATPase component TadA [Pusillimonas sp.]|nr:Flp pilus assembly complex ATPase component TadA [Pusillimonas sp.]